MGSSPNKEEGKGEEQRIDDGLKDDGNAGGRHSSLFICNVNSGEQPIQRKRERAVSSEPNQSPLFTYKLFTLQNNEKYKKQ